MQVIMCVILNEISGQSTPREWNTRYVYLGIVRVNQHTEHKHTVHQYTAHRKRVHQHTAQQFTTTQAHSSPAHKLTIHKHTAHKHTSSPAHSIVHQHSVHKHTSSPMAHDCLIRFSAHEFTFLNIFANRSMFIYIHVISRL